MSPCPPRSRPRVPATPWACVAETRGFVLGWAHLRGGGGCTPFVFLVPRWCLGRVSSQKVTLMLARECTDVGFGSAAYVAAGLETDLMR